MAEDDKLKTVSFKMVSLAKKGGGGGGVELAL